MAAAAGAPHVVLLKRPMPVAIGALADALAKLEGQSALDIAPRLRHSPGLLAAGLPLSVAEQRARDLTAKGFEAIAVPEGDYAGLPAAEAAMTLSIGDQLAVKMHGPDVLAAWSQVSVLAVAIVRTFTT